MIPNPMLFETLDVFRAISIRSENRNAMPLSDLENISLGFFCGAVDCTLLQATNYWKNAKQQGLPFSLDPRVLYRGYTVNVLQNGFCVMSQFFLAGQLKGLMTGGTDRPLSNTEKIVSGVSAGAISSVVAGPMELVMIQQQVKGGGLVSTASSLLSKGPSTVFRGTSGMMLREGIYAGGFLGFIPVAREQVQKQYPSLSADQARLVATFVAGPICSMCSHPPDTIKTCLQGDIEGGKYKNYGQAIRSVVAERGVRALWVRAAPSLACWPKLIGWLMPRPLPSIRLYRGAIRRLTHRVRMAALVPSRGRRAPHGASSANSAVFCCLTRSTPTSHHSSSRTPSRSRASRQGRRTCEVT